MTKAYSYTFQKARKIIVIIITLFKIEKLTLLSARVVP